jgi:hypothetical protein
MRIQTYLFLALLLLPTTASASFPDVPVSHNYFQAINWAQAGGIIEGYPDGTFRPDADVNRAEFVKIIMIARAVKSFNSGLDTGMEKTYVAECSPGAHPYHLFSDIHSKQWFDKYLCEALQRSVIAGYPDGTFYPARTINFAEAAKVVTNALIYNEPFPQLRFDESWHVQYVQGLSQIGAIPPTLTGPATPVTRGEMIDMMYRISKYQGLVQDKPWYCTADGTPTAIGRSIAPKKQEYSHLGFFGELFTASECSSQRMQGLFGVSDGKYTLKPDIAVSPDASEELLELLGDIGFECQQSNSETGKCWHWTLWEIVPVSEILKLKPYASEIESDGCINCG